MSRTWIYRLEVALYGRRDSNLDYLAGVVQLPLHFGEYFAYALLGAAAVLVYDLHLQRPPKLCAGQ